MFSFSDVFFPNYMFFHEAGTKGFPVVYSRVKVTVSISLNKRMSF